MKPRSAGIIVLSEDRRKLLVLRAYKNWDFPKGRIEPGETPLQAAIRETEEETTLKALNFPWGECFLDTGPYGRENKIARYFLAEVSRDPGAADVSLPVSEELGRPEHNEFRWVSFQEAFLLLPNRLIPVVRWAERLVNAKTGSGESRQSA